MVAWVGQAPSGGAFRAREGGAAAVVNGHLLVCGGWTNAGLANDVWQLSEHLQSPPRLLPARACSTTGAFLTHRYGHTATACGPGCGWLLVHAGMQSGGYSGETACVYVLRPERDYEWSSPANGDSTRPLRRGYHSAAASIDGRYLYVFGGIARGVSIDDLSVLDTATWTWRHVPKPAVGEGAWPPARFGHSAIVFPERGGGESLWLFGGGWGGDLLRDGDEHEDVWRFDIASETWQEVTAEAGFELPRAFAPNLGRCQCAHPACFLPI